MNGFELRPSYGSEHYHDLFIEVDVEKGMRVEDLIGVAIPCMDGQVWSIKEEEVPQMLNRKHTRHSALRRVRHLSREQIKAMEDLQ